ncbi:MAG: NRDE family protein [Pirellulaceae bacterium]|nr:NRDE family protein [Pirellulaceae bacterium]
MCLLAVLYRLVPESPILVAANREEYYDRPSQPPSIQSGKPRVLCGMDQRAGGTWMGVNQHGMFVGLCNRRAGGGADSVGARSRGLIAREVLRCGSARVAIDKAVDEMVTHRYQPFNLIVCDYESGWVVYNDGERHDVMPLEDGLNIIGNLDLNDPIDDRVQLAHRLLTLQNLDSPVKFLAVASKVFARSPTPSSRASMVIRGGDYGTISSTLIALSPKPRDAIFQFAAGAPDQSKYEDFSPMLRDILSRGLREARTKVKVTT